MKIKRISLRFNLDNEGDRKAWEALHQLDTQSINREIIARINTKELTNGLKDLIRQVLSEELAKALKGSMIQPISPSKTNEEEITSVFDFLDSF